MAVEERAMGRTGLEGGREWGLWEPSLSLPWLLGGVGGICTRSSGESGGSGLAGLHSALLGPQRSAERGPQPALILWPRVLGPDQLQHPKPLCAVREMGADIPGADRWAPPHLCHQRPGSFEPHPW